MCDRADSLRLCTDVRLKVCALASASRLKEIDRLGEHGKNVRPVALHVILGAGHGEYLAVFRDLHDRDVVGKGKRIAERVKRVYVRLSRRGVESDLGARLTDNVYSDIDLDLSADDAARGQVGFHSLLEEAVAARCLYGTVQVSRIHALYFGGYVAVARSGGAARASECGHALQH